LSKGAGKNRRAIAIFGGTFDPIHCGHLTIASAAARRFHLDRIYFVPSSRPPHKESRELAAFSHRYAMVALACANKPRFMPSLAEAPTEQGLSKVFYSIDTVRRFRKEHANEKIYFILGADSFLEIAIWKHYEALLDLCDFIIANRPGIRMEELHRVIPTKLLSDRNASSDNVLELKKTTVHLLTTVASTVSSTQIRKRCKRKMLSIRGLVPPAVEDYIHRQALYQ
jgi:nicotinate-nucleotide adenylyltransferase